MACQNDTLILVLTALGTVPDFFLQLLHVGCRVGIVETIAGGAALFHVVERDTDVMRLGIKVLFPIHPRHGGPTKGTKAVVVSIDLTFVKQRLVGFVDEGLAQGWLDVIGHVR